jgi:hypothetical protein
MSIIGLLGVLCFSAVSCAATRIVYEKKTFINIVEGDKPGEYGIDESETPMYPMCIDLDGNVYMLDRFNNRIQKYDKNGKLLKVIKIRAYEGKKIIPENPELDTYEKPIYEVRLIDVDKDGNLYAFETFSKQTVKYDQNGTELACITEEASKQQGFINSFPGIDALGRPYLATKNNKKAYVEINGTKITTLELSEFPDGIYPIKGNFYVKDLLEGNSYWIEDGESENEKDIVIRHLNSIKNKINIKINEKINYFHLVHVDKYGNIQVNLASNPQSDKIITYERIYNAADNSILAETMIVGGYNTVEKVHNDTPSLTWQDYIMDRDGNMYQWHIYEAAPFSIVKWERKYIR